MAKSLTLKGVSAAVIDAHTPRNSPPGNAALAVSGGDVIVKKLTITGANTDNPDASDPGGALTNSATLHLDQVTGDRQSRRSRRRHLEQRGPDDDAKRRHGKRRPGLGRRSPQHGDGIDRSQLDLRTAETGSGIRNGWLGAPGSLTLSNSTVSGNHVMPEGGAGIRNEAGDVTITASTIANNTAGNESPGGILNAGTMTIMRSTITGNEGDALSGIYQGRVTITASIVSDNLFDNQRSNCAARFASGGYNLLGSDCADSAVATDVVSDAPNLKPLAGVGGPTKTMVPRPASPRWT